LLVQAHVAAGGAVSPDGQWVRFSERIVKGGADLYVASARQPSTPVTITAMTETGDIGARFTDDSRYVLGEILALPSPDSGPLDAWTIPDGHAVQVPTTGEVWTWTAAGGARVIVADNYRRKLPGHDLTDLHVANL